MSKILCLVSLLLLSACVTPEPELVYLPEFDQNMAKKQMEKGKNTIFGSSFLTTIVCDVDGKFEFEKVGDGSFFVVSSVVWGVDGRNGIINYYGGGMMLPVTVKNGETKKIVVTR